MFKLIKNNRAASDKWKTLTLTANDTPHSVKIPVGPVLVPLSVWRARRTELIHREYEHGWPLGIWLTAEEGAESITRDVDDLSVIAIESGSEDTFGNKDNVLSGWFDFKSADLSRQLAAAAG